MTKSVRHLLSIYVLTFLSGFACVNAQSAPDALPVSNIYDRSPTTLPTTDLSAEHWLVGTLYDYAWGSAAGQKTAEGRLEGYLVQHFARLLRADGVEALEADYVAVAATSKVIKVMDVITEPSQFLEKADFFAFQELASQRLNR